MQNCDYMTPTRLILGKGSIQNMVKQCRYMARRCSLHMAAVVLKQLVYMMKP